MRWLAAVRVQPNAEPSRILDWVQGPLRKFFPFARALLIHAEVSLEKIAVSHILQVGHESSYLDQLPAAFELSERGCLRWWLENQRPFGVDPDRPPAIATATEIAEIKQFEFGRIAAHGTVDIKSKAGTYFSFAGIPEPLTSWHCAALTLLTPTLNDLFLAYIRDQLKKSGNTGQRLTTRQREIVRLLIKGMGNKTIAKEMGLSEKTVRNQLSAVYRSYGVGKRSELAALLR